ncbi:TMEM165/GDT1 family protein [Rugosimonospora acidiphila]|uniref:GDT1 family protein n=1 Tax=Rugosimonospora acidiphila TaxID=556531 RepID=A0ABP9RH96_9ACTN
MTGYVIAALTAFVLIVPVELPDKTFVATLVLATRYRPWPVWLGVVVAFGVQTAVAVLAGRLITLLPAAPVRLVAAGLFAVGAVLLVRSARRAGMEEQHQEHKFERKLASDQDERRDFLRAAGASFLVLFAAEWGDLSQLLTVGLVARGGHAAAVFVGSWVGLAAVSGTAVVLGRVLLKYVSLAMVQYVGSGICAILAVLTAISALT